MKSTFAHLIRYSLIVRNLTGNGVYLTPDELISRMERDCADREIGFPSDRQAAMRLLQRDFSNIWYLFGITVTHARYKGYYIQEVDNSSAYYHYEKLIADYDMLMAVNPDAELSPYIFAERHRPVGSVNIYPILKAIKKSHSIEFDYTLVRHDNALRHYRINPHFLKEDQQRWYVIGVHEDGFKIFGIDRISNLIIDEDSTFTRDTAFDPRTAFDNCYGIWDDQSLPIEEIELSYDALDGSFLKRVPLHPSQTILVDTPDEFRIQVKLRITNDFVMALLSRSRSLTVIKPQSLRERIHATLSAAASRNAPSAGEPV